jgi:hypothetical protein
MMIHPKTGNEIIIDADTMPIKLPNTEQEVFDKVASHLLTQNKKALDEENYCVYLAPDGCKCAAGCLIPDEQYVYTIEGSTWSWLKDRGYVENKHYSLIRRLQICHDTQKPHEWPSCLEKIAEEFNLEWKF